MAELAAQVKREVDGNADLAEEAKGQARLEALKKVRAIVEDPRQAAEKKGTLCAPIWAAQRAEEQWALLAAYRAEYQLNPPLKDSAAVTANAYFLGKARELFKVQCRVCYGYGHTKDYCSTLPRLKAATARD